MDHSSRKRVRLTERHDAAGSQVCQNCHNDHAHDPAQQVEEDTPPHGGAQGPGTGHGKRNGAKWSLSQEGAGAGRPGGSPLGQL